MPGGPGLIPPAAGRARWPSTESIAKALAATETALETFVRLIDAGGGAVRPVPRTGWAEAGASVHFDESRFPAADGCREIALPMLNDEDALALQISGRAMEPAYRDGDIIVVSPSAPLRRGDRVVVRTKTGEVLANELKRRTAKSIELKSLDGEHADRTLPTADVAWIARILWVSQ